MQVIGIPAELQGWESTLQLPPGSKRPGSKRPAGHFAHGYNGGCGTIKRSAAETARKGVPVSPTERSEPDELGYATVGRKVAGSSPEWREEAKFRVGAEVGSGGGGASRRRGGADIFTIFSLQTKNHRQKNA